MKTTLHLAAWLLVLLALDAVQARTDVPPDLDADFDIAIPDKVVSTVTDKGGRPVRTVSLRFLITRSGKPAEFVTTVPREEIVVEEDGQPVLNLELTQPNTQPLTVVLALDISGSMARSGKIDKAKEAALSFLDRVNGRAKVGLILFDHEVRVAEPPPPQIDQSGQHRLLLRRLISDAKPQGGTAYLDAATRAVEMLKDVKGRRAAVVMTDGADTNSAKKLREAIDAARAAETPVYTVGIGDPGKNDKVTTVLVLDRSGSMIGKADDGDAGTKIDALKQAGERFVALMRPGAESTVLPFSDTVETPKPITDDRVDLVRRIKSIDPLGGTLLYDATHAGIETLEASGREGKKAVVVLTDGKDEAPGSRRSDDDVVARAKETKTPLYMLGLGRPGEINEGVMQKMAESTGGKYYHAGSTKRLVEVFESLSIELHDDGIDEKSLTELAEKTGGKYTHVKDFSKLQLIYEQLAEELTAAYSVKFESRRPSHDGTARGIDVKVVRDGKVRSKGGKAETAVAGVAVPQMSYGVYLVSLAILGGLLALPGMVRRKAG